MTGKWSLAGAGLLALFTTVLVTASQGAATPTTPRRGGNPVAAKVFNPVPATEASIDAGRKTYRTFCPRCHGPEGKGDGGGAGAENDEREEKE